VAHHDGHGRDGDAGVAVATWLRCVGRGGGRGGAGGIADWAMGGWMGDFHRHWPTWPNVAW
jgi:hypothetical protein